MSIITTGLIHPLPPAGSNGGGNGGNGGGNGGSDNNSNNCEPQLIQYDWGIVNYEVLPQTAPANLINYEAVP